MADNAGYLPVDIVIICVCCNMFEIFSAVFWGFAILNFLSRKLQVHEFNQHTLYIVKWLH